ncbi:hypothetical protein ACWJKU_13760 [Methylocaldum sp. MU1018]
MFTSKTKIARRITSLVVAFLFVTSAFATTLTIEAVGNGTPQDVEWVRQQLDMATGTFVQIDPATGAVTVGAGGNALADYLRTIVNAPEAVRMGVDSATPGVVLGRWYQNDANQRQVLDVADLMLLPIGDANTVGPTRASVLFHEIAQMYGSLRDGTAYDDAHTYATGIENTVYQTLGSRGRRTNPQSTVFEDSQNPGNFRSFTDFSADGIDWIIEDFIRNQGDLITTSWQPDWMGPIDQTVPRTDLQWLGYSAYPAPEPSALTLFFVGLVALVYMRRGIAPDIA